MARRSRNFRRTEGEPRNRARSSGARKTARSTDPTSAKSARLPLRWCDRARPALHSAEIDSTPLSPRTEARREKASAEAISAELAPRKEGRPERTAIASRKFVFPPPFSPKSRVVPGEKERD